MMKINHFLIVCYRTYAKFNLV
nr:unnamed protein product [Callosobruchus analis]